MRKLFDIGKTNRFYFLLRYLTFLFILPQENIDCLCLHCQSNSYSDFYPCRLFSLVKKAKDIKHWTELWNILTCHYNSNLHIFGWMLKILLGTWRRLLIWILPNITKMWRILLLFLFIIIFSAFCFKSPWCWWGGAKHVIFYNYCFDEHLIFVRVFVDSAINMPPFSSSCALIVLPSSARECQQAWAHSCPVSSEICTVKSLL